MNIRIYWHNEHEPHIINEIEVSTVEAAAQLMIKAQEQGKVIIKIIGKIRGNKCCAAPPTNEHCIDCPLVEKTCTTTAQQG